MWFVMIGGLQCFAGPSASYFSGERTHCTGEGLWETHGTCGQCFTGDVWEHMSDTYSYPGNMNYMLIADFENFAEFTVCTIFMSWEILLKTSQCMIRNIAMSVCQPIFVFRLLKQKWNNFNQKVGSANPLGWDGRWDHEMISSFAGKTPSPEGEKAQASELQKLFQEGRVRISFAF